MHITYEYDLTVWKQIHKWQVLSPEGFLVTLSAKKSSLILGVNKAAFRRESHFDNTLLYFITMPYDIEVHKGHLTAELK